MWFLSEFLSRFYESAMMFVPKKTLKKSMESVL